MAGKVGGPPGNAFELVYGGTTDAVRKKMHAVDPVLSEYIRCLVRLQPNQNTVGRLPLTVIACWRHRLHLYGDVYSSPGLDLRQKQLLMVSFLSEANMHDQLFGHLLAVRLPCLRSSSAALVGVGTRQATPSRAAAGFQIWQHAEQLPEGN